MRTLIVLALLLPLLAGCAPRAWLVRGMADQLAQQGRSDDDDLLLARDAAAFYLKLSESVLREAPGHLALAEAVAGGYTQYAYAFVAAEADRVETRDIRAAQQLRQRAVRLYWRAQRDAMRALETSQPGLRAALARGDAQLRDDEVGVAYWAAAAWGAAIALSKDQPAAVADLPLAMRLAELAWQRAPAHRDGALAALMGSFEAARPAGSRARAERYFAQAVQAGARRNAGVYVAQAEALALPAGDRAQFEALLREAIAAGSGRTDLASQVMSARAQWLLDTVEDRF